MIVLYCPDEASASSVVEVLASARLRFKSAQGGTGVAQDRRGLQLELLRDRTRVYVGELPATAALRCELTTLVAQLLPRHLTANLIIRPFVPFDDEPS
ncbi:hypothetical protein [Gloeobacter kilaueensis]|uniref:Uncharacterized protein n=1 Tax=Gloeobacter kilaueensis (strain ATCC BAA-2537 / CCAP 1431/1 / ULC 316 / JS1) TaxID=1183438 RepID=U5QNR6_GLOK1|nr:hypothetical protein [Gloeobacter kilaueensis]AGY60637.1 hypothetical protein GKIL_4391 [Gloeobacter kilaueensis JS1]